MRKDTICFSLTLEMFFQEYSPRNEYSQTCRELPGNGKDDNLRAEWERGYEGLLTLSIRTISVQQYLMVTT